MARFNFSHGDHDLHEKTLFTLRAAADECRKSVATMLDTKGPEIRTGFLENNAPVQLDEVRFDVLIVGLNDYE